MLPEAELNVKKTDKTKLLISFIYYKWAGSEEVRGIRVDWCIVKWIQ